MTFNPADLLGTLPALILLIGGLVVLTSEVFLKQLKQGQQGGVQPDRRYQAVGAAVCAALALWASSSELSDPSTAIFG
ncbi:MAG: hypothetical protein JST92_10365, partial [Deltaproteobacteria bacterium]|nr:hypothetical protein [Deltaproteobacteria bacterium]